MRSLLLIVGTALILGGGAVKGAPRVCDSLGKLDLRDVDGYLQRLEQSRTPAAMAIRREIADAPRLLALEIRDCKREGLPISVEQIQRPIYPPALNAADDYRMAPWSLSLSQAVAHDIYVMASWSGGSPEEISRARRVLAAHPEAIAVLQRTLNKPYCTMPLARVFGPAGSINLTGFGQAEEIIQAQAFLQFVQEGKFGEAAWNLSRAFQLAGHLAQLEPGPSGFHMAQEVERRTLARMERILYVAGPNSRVDNDVVNEIQAHFVTLNLRKMLGGGIVETRLWFDKFRNYSPRDLVNAALFDTLPETAVTSRPLSPAAQRFLRQLLDMVEARRLRTIRKFCHSARAPYPVRLALFHTIQLSGDSEAAPEDAFGQLGDPPRFVSYADADAALQTQEQAVILAAKILAYRARHGSFPQTLASASLSAPIDPLTGKKFRYHREGTGFVIEGQQRQQEATIQPPTTLFPHSVYILKPGNPPDYFRYPLSRADQQVLISSD